jgi:hypothetical protein
MTNKNTRMSVQTTLEPLKLTWLRRDLNLRPWAKPQAKPLFFQISGTIKSRLLPA